MEFMLGLNWIEIKFSSKPLHLTQVPSSSKKMSFICQLEYCSPHFLSSVSQQLLIPLHQPPKSFSSSNLKLQIWMFKCLMILPIKMNFNRLKFSPTPSLFCVLSFNLPFKVNQTLFSLIYRMTIINFTIYKNQAKFLLSVKLSPGDTFSTWNSYFLDIITRIPKVLRENFIELFNLFRYAISFELAKVVMSHFASFMG